MRFNSNQKVAMSIGWVAFAITCAFPLRRTGEHTFKMAEPFSLPAIDITILAWVAIAIGTAWAAIILSPTAGSTAEAAKAPSASESP